MDHARCSLRPTESHASLVAAERDPVAEGPAKARGLRLVRPELDARFRPRFFEQSPWFWPIARSASVFAEHADWPDVDEYGAAFDVEPPVRFERAPARRRRPEGPIVRTDLYDAMIVERRAVSTRPRMWHDFLNALVWTAFPRAKLALHRRQHAAIERWIPEGATRLPNARTRELDTLALVDEGGVVVLRFGEDDARPLIFGHALYEGLVFGQDAMVARAVVIDARTEDVGGEKNILRYADGLLAAILADTTRIRTPDELSRHPL